MYNIVAGDQCRAMADFCAVESREQILYTANKLSNIEITVFRAGVVKFGILRKKEWKVLYQSHMIGG